MSSDHSQVRAHILIFPAPLQGHVPPILSLAELLSSDPNLYVTFLNTEHIHNRITSASHVLHHYSSLPNFRFLTIPDGLPVDHPRSFVGFLDILDSLSINSKEDYKKILSEEVNGWPSVTCVAADGLLPLAYEVAVEMDVPTMIVRTSSACSVLAYYSARALIDSGEVPFLDAADDGQGNVDLDKAVRSVPGMQSFLRRRDLPSLIKQCKSTNDRALRYVLATSDYLNHAEALVLNTVDTIEELALSHLRSICACIYRVGPLHSLTESHSASYWKEDLSCLPWLDAQRPKSVVYVSFGSITVVSERDLIEFWHGLVDSGYPFLWVIRPDSVDGGGVVGKLKEETKAGSGCIVEWAPQKEVLGHGSVGCFLTHGGWNSTLESIAAGVPMICWPFLGDQMINSRFVEEVWRVGVDMKDLGGRGVVEKMVREVMEGRRADEMRRRVNQMKSLAADSVKEGGTSREDLKRLILHIKSLSFR